MKNTLKLFGSTLEQACTIAREHFGSQGVSNSAQNISSALAVGAASERAGGPAFPVNKWIAALASAVVFSQAPSFAQAPITVDDPTQIAAAAPEAPNDGRTEGNTGARIAGGVGGAVIGALLTQGSGGLAKTAAIMGLGYLGQTAGDILTRNVTDQSGNPLIKVGTDSRGQPIYQTIATTVLRPGAQIPQRITKNVYDEAVSRASSPVPMQAAAGVNGEHYRTLDVSTHTGLYTLMLDAVAGRSVAKLAKSDLDAAELARAVAPNDPKRIVEFSVANRTYEQAFRSYAMSFQQVSKILEIADKNGFDVSSQNLMMAVVPGDLRAEVGTTVRWPGLDDRIRLLGAGMHAFKDATYSELVSMGKRPEQAARQRH